MISSTSNPRVKAIAALHKRRMRDTEQRFLIEGSRPLRRALDSEWPVLEVLHVPNGSSEVEAAVAAAEAAGAQITEVGEAVLRKIAYRTEPEGVVAVAAHRPFRLDALPEDPAGLYLVTEAIEKPGNVGAMLRTAEAAGVTALIAADAATDVTNPNVVRASQGALFSVPVAVASAEETLDWLLQHGLRPLVAAPNTGNVLWDTNLTGGVGVVVGSEHAGVSPVWERCDTLHVPMLGNADSLNAATTAAIIVYEAHRQRSVESGATSV